MVNCDSSKIETGLATLGGFDDLQMLTNLYIGNNFSLKQCEAQTFADDLINNQACTGTATFSNDTGVGICP